MSKPTALPMNKSKQGLWKRWLKWLGLGLVGLIAILLIVNMILNGWAGAKLEAKLKKLRAAGQPVCIADLAPRPIPDEQNAAVRLLHMQPELKRFDKAMVEFEERTPLGKEYVERTDKNENVLPTAVQAAAMQAILDNFGDLFLAVDEAATCRQYASQLDFAVDQPHFIENMIGDGSIPIRSVARLLSWKMQVLTVQGQGDQAVKTGIQLLHLTRLYDEEPTLVNALIGFACRGIAVQRLNQTLRSGSISADGRVALEAELARHDDPQHFVEVLRTERALSLDAIASFKIAPLPINWHFTFWQCDMIDCFEQQFALAQLPWHLAQRQIDKIDAAQYPVIIQLLFPALQAAHDAYHRNIAAMRCLRILNAAGAYYDKNGDQPTQLTDLLLPAAATEDPFSGKPLAFRLTDDGWLIYTVFVNGSDDGGEFAELADWGLTPLPKED